jgi:hypothetical protein
MYNINNLCYLRDEGLYPHESKLFHPGTIKQGSTNLIRLTKEIMSCTWVRNEGDHLTGFKIIISSYLININ